VQIHTRVAHAGHALGRVRPWVLRDATLGSHHGLRAGRADVTCLTRAWCVIECDFSSTGVTQYSTHENKESVHGQNYFATRHRAHSRRGTLPSVNKQVALGRVQFDDDSIVADPEAMQPGQLATQWGDVWVLLGADAGPLQGMNDPIPCLLVQPFQRLSRPVVEEDFKHAASASPRA
jgi:hypothetical protein